MVRVDLRTVTLDDPAAGRDHPRQRLVKVNAVSTSAWSTRARRSIEVEHYLYATSQIAQTTLRSVLGKADLDELLSEREQLNERLQHIIDEHTDPWGIKVTDGRGQGRRAARRMQRAMARQAEAERERRAKIIHAEGEFQASQRLPTRPT